MKTYYLNIEENLVALSALLRVRSLSFLKPSSTKKTNVALWQGFLNVTGRIVHQNGHSFLSLESLRKTSKPGYGGFYV